jgi:hypothetical protein
MEEKGRQRKLLSQTLIGMKEMGKEKVGEKKKKRKVWLT